MLELGKVRKTLVGDGGVMLKGMSGGERKRLAVGIELLSNPQILLLDEPTSGLDTPSAYDMISCLRRMADNGACIIVTIHQPNSKIWNLFDRAIVLSNGASVYNGNRAAMPDFIERHFGQKMPSMYNPADYILDCLRAQPSITVDDHSSPNEEGSAIEMNGNEAEDPQITSRLPRNSFDEL